VLNRREKLAIIGAGPTGALLAILLNQRGFTDIELYEGRADPREMSAAAGRSINLALADRGIHALKVAGVFEQLRAALLPMRGRLIHPVSGAASFQPYGQRPNEVNYSISRHRLNQDLVRIAAQRAGIKFHFEHRLQEVDVERGVASVRDLRRDALIEVPMRPLLGADGAGSMLRRRLAESHLISAREVDLEHGYKELSIPALPDQSFAMRPDSLHIWPRGKLMLIALPNEDGSFTATLFLPKLGAQSFESLRTGGAERFLAQHFADAVPLMPHHASELANHPVGFLGSVHAAPWHHAGQCLLLGDAAHAMVPFHGQGMNCCFEDCVALAHLLDQHRTWADLFGAFVAQRKPNTDAIAAMALENYLEMREHVAEPKFQLQQALALELERRFPQRFIPRYSMVMFHHDIPYEVAQARGKIQSDILSTLTHEGVQGLAAVDYERARAEIESRLPAL
jgi:kynurenine 3-monooxygenase